MSWSDLARLGITLRPYDDPPRSGETYSPFDAPLSSTLETLERELRYLSATKIVLQVGYRDRDLRVDGMPRADARMRHDAVALSFDSKWGPLRYETNEFVPRGYSRGHVGWQQNLRAIALGMEALRKVDRYGVSKRGEQYSGWRQIPARTGTPEDLITTADEAWKVICDNAGIPVDSSPLLNGISQSAAIAAALKNAHPDRGGTADRLRAVVRARELLGGTA